MTIDPQFSRATLPTDPATRAAHLAASSSADNKSPTPGALLSGTALTVFRLNGQFLAVSEKLTRDVGLTAASWQVLGAVLFDPLPVAGIARAMGLTRQSVQRVADVLVERGQAEYVANPAHARAKLLQPTDAGRQAIAAVGPGHFDLADKLAQELGPEEFRAVLKALRKLTEAMEVVAPD
jgi:DNA-binding MarR family transcriptional regulator